MAHCRSLFQRLICLVTTADSTPVMTKMVTMTTSVTDLLPWKRILNQGMIFLFLVFCSICKFIWSWSNLQNHAMSVLTSTYSQNWLFCITGIDTVHNQYYAIMYDLLFFSVFFFIFSHRPLQRLPVVISILPTKQFLKGGFPLLNIYNALQIA